MEIKKQLRTKTSPEKVWDLITNSDLIEQYMFSCRLDTTWKVGEKFNWDGPTADGNLITYVSGILLAIEEGKYLKFSLFPAGSDIEDIPENHISQSYTISVEGNETVLDIYQTDFVQAANGKKRFEESSVGWESILDTMKQLLEA